MRTLLIVIVLTLTGCGASEGPHKPLNDETSVQIAPQEQEADHSQGAQLFQSKACFSCHVKDSPVNAPFIQGQPAVYIFNQLNNFKNGLRTSDIMQPIAKQLNDSEIEALATWLSTQPTP